MCVRVFSVAWIDGPFRHCREKFVYMYVGTPDLEEFNVHKWCGCSLSIYKVLHENLVMC